MALIEKISNILDYYNIEKLNRTPQITELKQYSIQDKQKHANTLKILCILSHIESYDC